jgi:hypothetical protein
MLYFGAEFTQVYARRHGEGIRPSKYAVPISDEQRADQGMPRQEQVEDAARRNASRDREASGPSLGTNRVATERQKMEEE